MTTTVTASSSGSPTSSFTAVTNSSTNGQHYHHLPVASKQMPYNNRCRSPSPGLFQDFDLYNFSSDTLFSTYFAFILFWILKMSMSIIINGFFEILSFPQFDKF